MRRPALLHVSIPIAAALVAAASTTAQTAPPPAAHWAYARPERAPLPAVSRRGWSRNPVDRFVLARLEREGLSPSPEAERAVLIRRLHLDLLGLPPSPDDVAAFVGDDAPDAYERLVDRLLRSPHYGERMALSWLDLARFADTKGYLEDAGWSMWKWREWVIDACNENVPFDRFTVEQLAGDMLPDATLQQRIATGFHRNHPVTGQQDGQPGEYRHRYLADRVQTTGAVWLGLTLGCAECHDHKHDAIPQRDYYRVYAIFDNGEDVGLVEGDNPAPLVRLPSEQQGNRLADLQARIDALERRCDEGRAAVEAGAEAFVRGLREAPAVEAPAGELARFALDASVPGAELRGIGHAEWVPGVRGQALRLDGKDSFVECGQTGAVSVRDAFTVGAWVRFEGEDGDGGGVVVGKTDDSRQGRGWALGLGGGRPYFELIGSRMPRNDIYLAARDQLGRRRWRHVMATYDGSGKVSGLRLYVDGEPAVLDDVEDGDKPELDGDIDHRDPLRIGCTDGEPFAGAIDEVRLFARVLAPEEVRALVRRDLAHVAARGADAPPEARLLLRDYYERTESELAPQRRELAGLVRARREAMAEVPVVSVMAERAERRPTRMLLRGDYTTPGEVVEPGVPSLLPELLDGGVGDRLKLARWLVHPDHPLVGRVYVNRLWARLFGTGLVATLDDFGTQGERPSHPQLLDWLAREFVDGGFDRKALVRLLVTSQTYRQTSRCDADLLARDPGNRLLARMSRLPLDAEIVRDNALAIAGVLDRRVGGPSVRPWQPDGLWQAVATTAGQAYQPSPIADRHRRGLYVYRKRSAPFASFAVFDAPSHEACTVQRPRTNTPLQALVLLNDRVYAEAARGFAQRLLDGDGEDAARVRRAFVTAVAREPADAEVALVLGLLDRQRVHYREHRERAAEVAVLGDVPLHDGVEPSELAAWTAVCAVILNLDEAIRRC